MFNRGRWKPLVVFAIGLAVGVVVTCLFLRKVTQRTTFFGETDPASGYRCRITLPSDWKQKARLREMADNSFFVASSSSPLQQWIESRLLHRPASRPTTIYLSHSALRGFRLTGGYPEPTFVGQARLLTHRHLDVDGYHATMIRMNYPALASLHSEVLFVYAPDHSTVYTVYGSAAASHEEQLDREMQGVIASFHVEKVAVPAGGKR
ncbi:MAG: hypothetical protein JWL77_3103 [Chthonomonadaceae bacterium]|nr:hypothetical protein [Chthonomonadaceae bacterium]